MLLNLTGLLGPSSPALTGTMAGSLDRRGIRRAAQQKRAPVIPALAIFDCGRLTRRRACRWSRKRPPRREPADDQHHVSVMLVQTALIQLLLATAEAPPTSVAAAFGRKQSCLHNASKSAFGDDADLVRLRRLVRNW